MPGDVPARTLEAQAPRLVGGALCLDFVNTLSWRGRPGEARDRIADHAGFLDWAQAAGALPPAQARRARREAACHPAEAARALADAVALREAIARLFAGKGGAKDLRRLNRLLAEESRVPEIAPRDGGYAWSDARGRRPLRHPLAAIAWNAADLLTSDRRARVRSCADPDCGWMFLDTSRTHRRLWCSMADCGNRAKARRHYARAHGATLPSA